MMFVQVIWLILTLVFLIGLLWGMEQFVKRGEDR